MTDRTSDSALPQHVAAQRAIGWQEEFQKERGAFRGAFEHAAIGMALVDLAGRFVKVNRSLCQIVGYSEEELLRVDAPAITHPDDLPTMLSLGGQLLRDEIDHYHQEMRYRHKHGHIIWIQSSASIVRDEAGKPCYFVGQIQDITARKAAQQESARRIRQVERLTHAVSGILNALENTPDEQVYAEVVKILLDSFRSQKGLLLRLPANDTLTGPYVSPRGMQVVRCLPEDRCELWNQALNLETALVENGSRRMECGKGVARSLVAAMRHDGKPIGVIHIGDSENDFDPDDVDLLTRVSRMIAPAFHARMKREKLTSREAEVMDLIVAGKTQKEIAMELGISIQTTAKHRARVLQKLQVANDVELARLAFRMRTPAV